MGEVTGSALTNQPSPSPGFAAGPSLFQRERVFGATDRTLSLWERMDCRRQAG